MLELLIPRTKWSPDGLFILFALGVSLKTTNRNLCWFYHILKPRTLTLRLVEILLFSFCADILSNSRHIRDIFMLCTLLNFLWLNISLTKLRASGSDRISTNATRRLRPVKKLALGDVEDQNTAQHSKSCTKEKTLCENQRNNDRSKSTYALGVTRTMLIYQKEL